MDQIKSLDRKHLIGILILLLLLVAIPLTMYLIRQQQTIKSKAANDPRVQFGGSNVIAGDPPTANNPQVQITLNFPITSPVPSAVGLRGIRSGQNVALSWERLQYDGSSIYYLIRSGGWFGGHEGGFVSSGVRVLTGSTCVTFGPITQQPASTGLCIFENVPADTFFWIGKMKAKDGITDAHLVQHFKHATLGGVGPL